tara:strand:+ start:699 stop:1289 length:591 start_codon:yes stop_codon:yes gene_type:complete
MKQSKVLSLLLLISILLTCGCSNKKLITEESILQKADEVLDKGKAESAIEYNNFILGTQAKILNAILDLNWDSNSEAFNSEIKNLIQLLDNGLKIIDSIEVYQHGEDLKEAFKVQLHMHKDMVENDYLELFELVNIEPASEQEMKELSSKIDSITKRMEAKEAPIDEKLFTAQRRFAKKYGLKLQATEIQEKIDNL